MLIQVEEYKETEIRPWGSFTVLEVGENYKVKRFVVNPGHRLSLQYHLRRNEHWVVVAGQGLVNLDEEVRHIGVNDHVFVPLGAKHRVANVGDEPLIILEVQNGSYLGEDDIVRLDDDYRR